MTRATTLGAILAMVLTLVAPTLGTSLAAAGTTASSPVPRAAGLSYGDRLPNMSQQQLASTFADASALGVSWVRISFGWDRIQPISSTAYSWSDLDRVVTAARSYGLNVLGVIGFTPVWARPAGCSSPKCAPASSRRFAEFSAATARHYASLGVHTWEVWNEANISAFWQPRPDPGKYAELLAASVPSIRREDGRAFIISSGLAPSSTNGLNWSPLDYLQSLCAAGSNRLVDGIGYHPYSFPVTASFTATWNAWQSLATLPRNARKLLSDYGTPSLPIWATEYGAPTGGPGTQGTLQNNYGIGIYPDHVDEALQAAIAADVVTQWGATSLLQGLFWHTDRDLGTSDSTPENFYGLRRFDGTKKPAYEALQQGLAVLRATNTVASPLSSPSSGRRFQSLHRMSR